ncbi:MAG: hypothetical protein AB1767_12810 [Bacillota bacterium]
MHRFFVIEARRLLPLLFLLVLLVSLSIYDNFFRNAEQQVIVPDEEVKNVLTFVTADRGEMESNAEFRVVETAAQWVELQEEHTGMPDYPFNEVYEMAVRAVNGEIRNIQVFPQEDGSVQVQVRVNVQPNYYHVVTVERDKVAAVSRWLFLDQEDRILQEVVLTPADGDELELDEVVEETD